MKINKVKIECDLETSWPQPVVLFFRNGREGYTFHRAPSLYSFARLLGVLAVSHLKNRSLILNKDKTRLALWFVDEEQQA